MLSKLNNLISLLGNKTSLTRNKLAPGWASNKIESLLLIHKPESNKSAQLPNGFDCFEINTPNGKVQAYQMGSGPNVVFVHGLGGDARQFFLLMRGLSKCGFKTLTFDHLGHGMSDAKPATLKQTIATTNHVINIVKNKSTDGLSAVVGHATGCIAVVNAQQELIKDTPQFLISPVFNYKLFMLKKLAQLKLHKKLITEYISEFSTVYKKQYEKLELTKSLIKYADSTLIAHDKSDSISPIAESLRFCANNPITRLLVTKQYDHIRIISSESVWHELKSHLNYEDTTINYAQKILHQKSE